MQSASMTAAEAAQKTPVVWFCDLTYTQQTIASDIMPVGVAGIMTYMRANLDFNVATRLVKYPERLVEFLEAGEVPDVVAFSNYVWNCDLSSKFAAAIKARYPHVITVMGGPNYPTLPSEQEAFLRKHAAIDYYIMWEGEIPFTRLMQALKDCGFDRSKLDTDIPSLHHIDPQTDQFIACPLEARLRDLNAIPSPYLSGDMDEFFDGQLLPILQTKRGCPFSCTFCVEGNKYYSKVAKSVQDKVKDELTLIARKMSDLIESGKSRTDLHISDSNFGMFKDDVDVCRHIGDLQQQYDYPRYINVATGKNQKHRVLEAAKLVNGSLRLSGSVQSLDATILENIARDNIDEQGLMDLALQANEIGANSYSEIILGLPGDTVDAHMSSIRKVIEADFNSICLYQLMLLPGTDLASADSVKKWGMQTRYRVLPRCYGHYSLWGDDIRAGEIEQVCVANTTLSFEDYIELRRLHLIINVFFNDGVFKEAMQFVQALGLSKFEWIMRIYNHPLSGRFKAFVDEFLEETRHELWVDYDGFEDFLMTPGVIEKHIAGEYGANLIFKFKSVALTGYVSELAEIAQTTLKSFLEEMGEGGSVDFGLELIDFAAIRMRGIFDLDSPEIDRVFHYDVDRFASDLEVAPLESYARREPLELVFEQTDAQRAQVRSFLELYGADPIGLSRILAKIYVRRLFREVRRAESKGETLLSARDQAIGDGTLSGLNEFM